MWHTSVKYTLLKFLILTHFVICEEFDISVFMEKLENLADKIETRTNSKHADIETVMAKLDGLIQKTMNLFPLAHTDETDEEKFKPSQCSDKCREKLESVRQSILTDFVLELIEAVNEEKEQNKQIREELREFKDDITDGIPGVHFVEYSNKLTTLESKLEKLDLKYDAYLTKLRRNEEYLQTGLMEEIEALEEQTTELCIVEQQDDAFKTAETPFNNTVKVLKAEISAARQEIDFTVREIHNKQFYLRNQLTVLENKRLSIDSGLKQAVSEL